MCIRHRWVKLSADSELSWRERESESRRYDAAEELCDEEQNPTHRGDGADEDHSYSDGWVYWLLALFLILGVHCWSTH